MHRENCHCARCRRLSEMRWPAGGPVLGSTAHDMALERPFSEAEEIELAAELLSVSSEEELDLFLGKLFKSAWRGIKKVGRFVGKIAKPLGGVLKAIAKKALPFVGGALGSFIPIPGVGTALGSALGGAVSKALETELSGLSPDLQEFETARRFVRLAGSAARGAALASPDRDQQALLEAAVIDAARLHLPYLPALGALPLAAHAPALGASGRSGRWIRRGKGIVVLGV